MSYEVIVGVGIVSALLFMLFDRLDAKKHFLLRLIIVFLNVTFIMFIPLHLLGVDILNTFYKLYLYWTWLFWAYVTTAIFYYVIVKFGLVLPKKYRGSKR